MLFFSEPGNIPGAVIDFNLESAADAPSEIRSFAGRVDSSEYTLFLLLELANARLKLADYLERR